MHDLQRLRYVVHRYPHLQGLRIAPLGIPFLLSAAWRNGQLHWIPGTAGRGASYWFVGLMAVAVALALVLGQEYQKRFGSLEAAGDIRTPLIAATFGAALVASIWIQGTLETSFSLPMIVIGGGLAYVGYAGGALRVHYMAVATVAFAFATLGVFGVPVLLREILLDELIGLSLIVIGVGDHLLLRRTLDPNGHVEAI